MFTWYEEGDVLLRKGTLGPVIMAPERIKVSANMLIYVRNRKYFSINERLQVTPSFEWAHLYEKKTYTPALCNEHCTTVNATLFFLCFPLSRFFLSSNLKFPLRDYIYFFAEPPHCNFSIIWYIMRCEEFVVWFSKYLPTSKIVKVCQILKNINDFLQGN